MFRGGLLPVWAVPIQPDPAYRKVDRGHDSWYRWIALAWWVFASWKPFAPFAGRLIFLAGSFNYSSISKGQGRCILSNIWQCPLCYQPLLSLWFPVAVTRVAVTLDHWDAFFQRPLPGPFLSPLPCGFGPTGEKPEIPSPNRQASKTALQAPPSSQSFGRTAGLCTGNEINENRLFMLGPSAMAAGRNEHNKGPFCS